MTPAGRRWVTAGVLLLSFPGVGLSETPGARYGADHDTLEESVGAPSKPLPPRAAPAAGSPAATNPAVPIATAGLTAPRLAGEAPSAPVQVARSQTVAFIDRAANVPRTGASAISAPDPGGDARTPANGPVRAKAQAQPTAAVALRASQTQQQPVTSLHIAPTRPGQSPPAGATTQARQPATLTPVPTGQKGAADPAQQTTGSAVPAGTGPLSNAAPAGQATPNPATPVAASEQAGSPAATAMPEPPGAETPDSAKSFAQPQTSVPADDLAGSPVADGPAALIPWRVGLPPGVSGSVIIVPFSPTAGAAMFARGASTFIVFDERRPIDLGRLGTDRLFGTASVRLMPSATIMQLRLPANWAVTLNPNQLGWQIAVLGVSPRLQPITPGNGDRRISLPAEAPGRVVAIVDPETGANLLVGTQRRSGQGILNLRRGAEFALLPTGQGVVAEPLSDRVVLRPVMNGFALVGEPDGLMLSPGSSTDTLLADAMVLTRRFEFPSMATEQLHEHLIAQLNETAAVPPQARAPRRIAAARTLLALGMGAEAQALLALAAEQDPKEGLSPEVGGLSGIAALLAGRPEESGGLLDPRLSNSDEVSLWRAIRSALRGDAPSQAATLMASTAKLALTYPPGIRQHILPVVAETLIQGGALRPATAFLEQADDDTRLAFARALLKDARGDVQGALAAYDALANGPDRRDAVRAGVRAVELRLATGAITRHEATDQMERLFYAWRGDGSDLALRERVATLRQEAGEWRAALAIRREIETNFPEMAPAAHAKLQEVFAALLKNDNADRMAPLDLITLVDDNADLMPASAEAETLTARLADRLLALDLPKRADATLDKLIRAGMPGPGRATLGERLAALRLREGNPAGAAAALDASATPDLPADLASRRTLLAAQANAKLGNTDAATAALAALGTPEADAARATILETAQDWPAAEQALREYAAKTVPRSGQLNDVQRRTLLRLATAAARAGDDATLASLRAEQGSRIGNGPLGDMFRLLTAEPVRASADLKRSAAEANLARSIPGGLKAVETTPLP